MCHTITIKEVSLLLLDIQGPNSLPFGLGKLYIFPKLYITLTVFIFSWKVNQWESQDHVNTCTYIKSGVMTFGIRDLKVCIYHYNISFSSTLWAQCLHVSIIFSAIYFLAAFNSFSWGNTEQNRARFKNSFKCLEIVTFIHVFFLNWKA